MNAKVSKRFWLILPLVVASLFVGLVFAGCGHEHSYEWKIVSAATCTEAGLKEGVCSCGEKVSEVIEPLGHDFVFDGDEDEFTHSCTRCTESGECELEQKVVEPTCEAGGHTEVSCHLCHHTDEINPTEPLPHRFNEYRQYWRDGKSRHVRTCANCSYAEDAECTPTDDGREVEPTCEHAGYILHTCSVCHDQYELPSEKEALGHNYTYIHAVEADGKHYHTKHCTNETDDDQDEKIYCNFTITTTDADCTNAGKRHYYCPDCEHQYDETIDALGHEWTDWSFAEEISADSAKHIHTRTCQRQGCSEEEKKEFTFSQSKTEATCLVEGFTTYTCPDDDGACGGYSVTKKTEELKEHKWGSWTYLGDDTHKHYRNCSVGNHREEKACQENAVITPANCDRGGFTTHTCEDCKNEYTDTLTPIRAHSWGEWIKEEQEDHKTHTHECIYEDCDKTETFNCEYDIDETPATCQATGKKVYTCPDCQDSYEETLDMLAHIWGSYEKADREGYHWRYCSQGNHYEEAAACVDATPTTIDPTCEQGGHTENHCDICNQDFITDEKDALGHDWNEWQTTDDDHSHTCKRELCEYHTVPLTAAHDFAECSVCECGYDGLEYEVSGSYAHVLGYGKASGTKKVWLRATYKGQEVERIHERALENNKNLVEIKIDEGIKNIDNLAFNNCPNVEKISLPDSLISLGSNNISSKYLDNQENWTKVGNGRVLYIGHHLYSARDISGSYTVEPGTKSICRSAFMLNKGLTEIVIPNSIVFIGSYAFNDCVNLQKCVFDGTIGDWFKIFFVDELSNPLHYATEFHVDRASGTISLPEGVTSIPAGTFMGDTEITQIEIPSTVTEIGARAFYGCTNLATVIVKSEKIRSIGEDAFTGTAFYDNQSNWSNGVLYLDVKAEDGSTTCSYLLKADNEKLADNPEVIIKENTKLIAGGAFRNCTNLQKITICSTIEVIGINAFTGCSGLTSAIFETTWSWMAFSDSLNIGRHVGASKLKADPAEAARNLVFNDGGWTVYGKNS